MEVVLEVEEKKGEKQARFVGSVQKDTKKMLI